MKNPFENFSLERLDTDKTYRKAEAAIAASRIDEEELRQLYGEQVSVDLEKVAKLERQFSTQATPENTEMKKIAEIFEALILDCGELSNWFGENAFTMKTSHYDDYLNGVDMVIEFRGEEEGSASYLGLAADVTFASDTTKKFNRIKKHIELGELGKVKYFISDHMNIQGQLSKLPEVVIGADKKTVMNLGELWTSKDQESLAKHFAQVMILKQVREQLETFSLYARSVGQDEAASIYASRITLIDDILNEKKDIENANELEIMMDSVNSEIMSFIKSWKQELLKEK